MTKSYETLRGMLDEELKRAADRVRATRSELKRDLIQLEAELARRAKRRREEEVIL